MMRPMLRAVRTVAVPRRALGSCCALAQMGAPHAAERGERRLANASGALRAASGPVLLTRCLTRHAAAALAGAEKEVRIRAPRLSLLRESFFFFFFFFLFYFFFFFFQI